MADAVNRASRPAVVCGAVALVLAATAVSPAVAATSAIDSDAALARSQQAIGRTLGDHLLIDSGGEPLRLSSLLGEPLVISLVYTSCDHTCPALTLELKRIVGIAREALGEDSFSVLTVGFDSAADSPDRMRMFAAERGIADHRWRFASADAATLERLVDDLGFSYRATPRGFDHIAQTTVVDGDGTIYRQVYGQLIEPPALVEPLKDLVWGRQADGTSLKGWLTGVKLLCTVYDPSTGRYGIDYSIFVAAAIGLAALGSVAAFIVRIWRQSARVPAARIRRRSARSH